MAHQTILNLNKLFTLGARHTTHAVHKKNQDFFDTTLHYWIASHSYHVSIVHPFGYFSSLLCFSAAATIPFMPSHTRHPVGQGRGRPSGERRESD